MRGRKSQPASLKILRGNPGKRKIKDAPSPTIGAPTRPDWMPVDAQHEWDRVVPELDRLNILARIDAAVIEGHCLNYARAVQAERDLAEHGCTFVDSHGNEKKRPQATIAKECWTMVRAFLSELGLSPASRVKLGSPSESQPKSDIKAFIGLK